MTKTACSRRRYYSEFAITIPMRNEEECIHNVLLLCGEEEAEIGSHELTSGERVHIPIYMISFHRTQSEH
jgi:hypothetical protein